MRALVISDIHSNLPALEAVLAAAPQYDAVWKVLKTVHAQNGPKNTNHQ